MAVGWKKIWCRDEKIHKKFGKLRKKWSFAGILTDFLLTCMLLKRIQPLIIHRTLLQHRERAFGHKADYGRIREQQR